MEQLELERARKIIEELYKKAEREDRDGKIDKHTPREEKIGKCSCGGDIIVSISYFTEKLDGFIYDIKEKRGCYCKSCGLMYKEEIIRKNSENKSGT